MTEHYYTSLPSSEHHLRKVNVSVRGIQLVVYTDNGVFSKGGLDEGTKRLLDAVNLEGSDKVLDLGCGYGVVTAVLGTLYPGTNWTLIDVNERALELAKNNTAFMGDRRHLTRSDGIPEALSNAFDTILLNPPIRAGKPVVYRLYEDAFKALKPGGCLWVVIQKKHGAPSTLAFLENCFDEVEIVSKKSGYFIFRARKN